MKKKQSNVIMSCRQAVEYYVSSSSISLGRKYRTLGTVHAYYTVQNFSFYF
jgi:hypothetical protein